MAAAAAALRSSQPSAAVARGQANQLGLADIAPIQRARIVSAMFDVAAERGLANASVADVVERSGVSRRTFYQLFEDREACFLAALDEGLAFVSERVLAAALSESRWRERLRAALAAFLSSLDEQPTVARVLIVESLVAGGAAHERRSLALARVVAAIDEGRGEPGAASPPPLTAEGLVGGVLALLHARLMRPDGEPLLGLAGQLASMIVLPYLGAAAARRELEQPIPAPVVQRHGTGALHDPFKAAGMRLTYRTVRVLLAVAEHPGASNRRLGELAGVTDQGQASKLLGRLRRLGLIANDGLASGQGAPNAWSLTDAGRRLADSIPVHAESFEQ